MGEFRLGNTALNAYYLGNTEINNQILPDPYSPVKIFGTASIDGWWNNDTGSNYVSGETEYPAFPALYKVWYSWNDVVNNVSIISGSAPDNRKVWRSALWANDATGDYIGPGEGYSLAYAYNGGEESPSDNSTAISSNLPLTSSNDLSFFCVHQLNTNTTLDFVIPSTALYSEADPTETYQTVTLEFSKSLAPAQVTPRFRVYSYPTSSAGLPGTTDLINMTPYDYVYQGSYSGYFGFTYNQSTKEFKVYSNSTTPVTSSILTKDFVFDDARVEMYRRESALSNLWYEMLVINKIPTTEELELLDLYYRNKYTSISFTN